MFYKELKQITRSVLQRDLGGQALTKKLAAYDSPAEIFTSDDMLVTDSYLSLMHYDAGGRNGHGRRI